MPEATARRADLSVGRLSSFLVSESLLRASPIDLFVMTDAGPVPATLESWEVDAPRNDDGSLRAVPRLRLVVRATG